MTTGRLSKGFAALTFAGVAVLGMSGSVLAQESYPPGQGGTAPGQTEPGPGPGVQPAFSCTNPSADTPGACPRGAPMTASTPADTFSPGSPVEVGVESTYQKVGSTTATSSGEAILTFTVPTNLSNGRHDVVFTGTKNGAATTFRVPFTVQGTAAAADRGRGLPRTGSDELVALSIAGGTMVLVGAGVVVAARRRRDSEQFAAA